MAYRSSDFEDRFHEGSRRPEVRYAERERDRDQDRLGFLREDPRPVDAGPLVLRQREVETRDVARRPPSPSPIRYGHVDPGRRARSLTPPHIHEERDRIRIAERERATRAPRYVERSPSPRPRFERRCSPSPDRVRSRSRVRVIERERERRRSPSSSPSRSPSPPPPPPPVIRGPVIEREVITHYRDIDHAKLRTVGVVRARSPAPPPAPRPAPRPPTRTEERHLDIDIRTSRGRTDIGVRRSVSRHRSPSRERRSPHIHGNELVVRDDRHVGSRRRAHSAAPICSPVTEEAEYITSRIDSRGRMGEAWNGATKDWAIVDVPPGTERVRMDGVGGGAAEVTWQRYNGVRRSKFIPERDEAASAPAPAPAPPARDSRGYERELEIEISRDRRSRPAPKSKQNEMWTEITKDLVIRDAIIECGYDFEETEYFFYVMKYLKYDNVLELVQVSDDIRRYRRERERDKQRDREWRDHHSRRPSRRDYDERLREREIIVDNTRGVLRRAY
ncbi:hypothetical protein SODALDRAFT_325152 [Sodiomyces alkalinus F11]|uniref:DUF8035 domain-containing protein n=1 Tax=Sodiomyces alkalinus (strain CBS 110278 / VKM F-3762 / F11) TaxID=1314773 RepID=A0A3N2PSX9_SODAK|nr:hypothetical protein SODALDRAFT_325152 [Sodiomyces alkalinus F11]ROT37578.1 hypothetical protein SODALDRAFT_325152 [Sodiomyces alkalinus F11]